jgi:hypothetical protein
MLYEAATRVEVVRKTDSAEKIPAQAMRRLKLLWSTPASVSTTGGRRASGNCDNLHHIPRSPFLKIQCYYQAATIWVALDDERLNDCSRTCIVCMQVVGIVDQYHVVQQRRLTTFWCSFFLLHQSFSLSNGLGSKEARAG